MKKHQENVLELREVWKTYKMGKVQIDAIKEANLKIKKGEFIVIQGASGSGKSTMMHLVGCLDLPSRGSILLDGVEIKTMSKSRIASVRGRKIGFIFQDFNLIPTLNALENVMLPMEFQSNSGNAKERARELLELVGLGDRMNHKPNELSGGQAQRVAIARALANNPEIILADEPTGNLDSKTGEHIIDFLYKLYRKDGKTLIIVTHDTNLIKRIDNHARVIKLKDGMIVKK